MKSRSDLQNPKKQGGADLLSNNLKLRALQKTRNPELFAKTGNLTENLEVGFLRLLDSSVSVT